MYLSTKFGFSHEISVQPKKNKKVMTFSEYDKATIILFCSTLTCINDIFQKRRCLLYKKNKMEN